MDLNSTVNIIISPYGTATASLASIISLIISLYVAFSLNKIRKIFKFRVRVPKLVNSLNELASKLSNEINTFNHLNSDIRKILADIDVLLETLSNMSDNNIQKASKNIRTNIKSLENKGFLGFKKSPFSQNDYINLLTDIQIAIYKLHKQTMEKIEDAQWE